MPHTVVTGGALKGKILRFPKIPGLRPTPARLRQVIFGIIGHDMRGISVLDCFSGAGTLGIEALSRGASHCVFVERSKVAFNYLLRNLRDCHLLDKATAVFCDAFKVPKKVTDHGPYKLCFIDPPYSDAGRIPKLVEKLITLNVLETSSVIVMEYPYGVDEKVKGIASVNIFAQRRYGTTSLAFAEVLKR